MKSHLKLTAENIGNSVYIKTTDNFTCEGIIKSFTDTNLEVRNSTLRSTFTIFYFEIKEIDIINQHQNDKIQKVQHPIVEEIQPDFYEHPVFGRLFKCNKHMEYFNIRDLCQIDVAKTLIDVDVYKCNYVLINSSNHLYMNAMEQLKNYERIGISFYHNEYGSEIIKYLTISCSNLNLIIDVNGLSGDELKSKYSEMVSILKNEKYVKLLYGSHHTYSALKRLLQIELENFMDIQILYYGLHNIRVANKFKSGFTYSKMVELLFNVNFKLKNEANCTKEDIINKMAFNSHFLIPMYNLMISRFLEPVKLLSKRICSFKFNSEDGSEELNDLDLYNSSEINYEMLPRSLLFWTYKDNSTVLQAKKLIDSEMQNERQALIINSKSCDIVEINKNIARIEELKNSEMNYYEKISDDEDNEELDAYRISNNLWNNKKSEVFTETQNISPASVISVNSIDEKVGLKVENYIDCTPKLGVGRGRGFNRIINNFSNLKTEQFNIGNNCEDEVLKSEKINRASSNELKKIGLLKNNFKTTEYDNLSLKIDEYFDETSLKDSGSSTSNKLPDKVFGKGRGIKCPIKKPMSQSSSIDNSRQFLLNCNNNNAIEDTDYCEMSINRWNKNTPGKLSFDQFSDEKISSINKNNEAMGIMWSTLGINYAKETEELYKEFGL